MATHCVDELCILPAGHPGELHELPPELANELCPTCGAQPRMVVDGFPTLSRAEIVNGTGFAPRTRFLPVEPPA